MGEDYQRKLLDWRFEQSNYITAGKILINMIENVNKRKKLCNGMGWDGMPTKCLKKN